MLRRGLVVFFLFIFLKSGAQKPENGFPKWAVTVKPIGFFDPFLSNFTFGVQHNTDGRFIYELQAGLIQSWYCSFVQNETDLSMTGFKIGAEAKYLLYRKLFISAQLVHNNYNESSEELMWRFNRVYTQEMLIDKHITATAGHLKVGVYWHIPDKRLFFEFYGGIGVRYRTIAVDMDDFPEDAETVEPINFFSQDHFANDLNSEQYYASLALGFAVGLKLGK